MAIQIIHLLIKRRLFKGTFNSNNFIIPLNKSLHSNSLDNNNDYDDKVTNVNDALKLFNVMIHKRPVPSVVKFTRLLHHVTQLKQYSCSLDLFKQMCAFGFPLNKYTAGIAIKCYCRSRQTQHGLTVLGFCFKQGIEPHVSTYNTLLKGFIREQKTHEAEQLFFHFLRKPQLCEPNLVTYNTMVKGLCKVGSHYAAIGLLRLLDHDGRLGGGCKFDVYTYNTIVDSLCKDVVMIDHVCKLWEEMVGDKAIETNVHTYNSLLYNLCKLGHWDEVCVLLALMEDVNIHPEVKTFNIIVDALCKEGMIDEAQAVINIMVESGETCPPDIVTYNSLIEAYTWRHEMSEARRIFDSLASKCIKPNNDTYRKMMLGYMYDPSLSTGFTEFYNLLYGDHPPCPYKSVWFAFPNKLTYIESLKEAKYKEVVGLFRLMDGSGMNSDFDVHTTLICRAIKEGKIDDARRFFHDLPIKVSDDRRYKVTAFKVLHGGLDKVARLKEFKKWFPITDKREYKEQLRANNYYSWWPMEL